jgi:phosphatidylglycerophosphatase A
VGAVEGVAIFLAITALNLGHASRAFVFLTLNVVLFMVGVWASNKACARTRLEDPRLIVIDEVSGQVIALTPLAFWSSIPVIGIVIGFLLFRVFDIFKPYPIRKLERLHGGLGVMADDALAGIYAAALLAVAHLVRLI